MDQFTIERGLAILYPLIIALSFICCVTSAVAWTHWKYVLDTCIETNCGCYLFGLSSRTYFTGGHVAYCHFAVYGLVFPVIFAIIFGCFHVFRVCMGSGKRKTGTATVKQRSGEMIVITTQSEVQDNDVSPYYWTPSSVISAIMSLYTLIYAAIYTAGFNQSCNQYRIELIKYIQATGNLVGAIQGRISCAAVFDFMDFLHADVAMDRRRYDRINSPACYYMALISGWFAVFLWIATVWINIMGARLSRAVRV